MDKLFDNCISFEKCKNIILEPLEADYYILHPEKFCHELKCFIINNNEIKCSNKNQPLIKNHIEYLNFIYTDFGNKEFDDKYWFFIGKSTNGIYFSYESGCCGTGFGLGSKTKIYLSKSQELLSQYALSDKQRSIIDKNIDKFINDWKWK